MIDDYWLAMTSCTRIIKSLIKPISKRIETFRHIENWTEILNSNHLLLFCFLCYVDRSGRGRRWGNRRRWLGRNATEQRPLEVSDLANKQATTSHLLLSLTCASINNHLLHMTKNRSILSRPSAIIHCTRLLLLIIIVYYWLLFRLRLRPYLLKLHLIPVSPQPQP